jgi:tetratricopeptide (TPR) repeat protein
MPSLSLCLIVRDEETMLPGFLDATRSLRDEFIAVDTGSTDRTRELLTDAGATIIDHPWGDDFAAARNRSLAAARSDWILVLDADERPSEELAQQIRAVIADETVGAATVRMNLPLPHGHVRQSDLLRLWRHDPGILYAHRIHEDASAGVRSCLARDGRRLVNLTATCEHLGYVRDVAAARTKKERDRTLLRACLDDDPEDWYSWYKLLEVARFWNDEMLWRDTARRLGPRLTGPPAALLPRAPWIGELLALTAVGLSRKPMDQVRWLDPWESRVPPAPAFFLQRGLALERAGELERAEADFQRCRDLPAGTRPMDTTVRPLLGLCRIQAQRGDLLAAGDLVHQALTENPRDPEALLAAVSFAWLHGGAEARDAFVAEHRSLHGDSEELVLALGEQALQTGLWNEAETMLAPVAGDPPRGRAGELLLQSVMARGRIDEARDHCRRLMDEHPPAGMGYLTCCLILGEQVEFTIDLEQSEANAALKEWIAVLWRSRQSHHMSALVDHHRLVSGVFPWLTGYLTDQTEQLKRRLR